MNRYITTALLGLFLGVCIGYKNEEEIDDFYHKSLRSKKKAIRKIHKKYDELCDSLDLE